MEPVSGWRGAVVLGSRMREKVGLGGARVGVETD